jgi:hypothetical protein
MGRWAWLAALHRRFGEVRTFLEGEDLAKLRLIE